MQQAKPIKDFSLLPYQKSCSNCKDNSPRNFLLWALIESLFWEIKYSIEVRLLELEKIALIPMVQVPNISLTMTYNRIYVTRDSFISGGKSRQNEAGQNKMEKRIQF